MNSSSIGCRSSTMNLRNRERLLRNSLGESFENQVQKLKLTELHVHNILMNILHDEPVDSFDFSHISTRRVTRALERELEEKRKQDRKKDRNKSLNNTIFDMDFSDDEELDTEYNPLQNVNNIENSNFVLQNYHLQDLNNDTNYPNTRSRHNESAYYMSDDYRFFDNTNSIYDDDPIYRDFLTNLENNEQCDFSQDEEDDPEFDPSQEPNFFENFDDDDNESIKISKSEIKQFVEDLDTPNFITDVIVVSQSNDANEDSNSNVSKQIIPSTPNDHENEELLKKQSTKFVHVSPDEYKFYDFSTSASCIHGKGIMTKDEEEQFVTQTEMLTQLLLQFIVCYHFDEIDVSYINLYKTMLNNLLYYQASSSTHSLIRKVRNIASAVNHCQTLINLRVDTFDHQLMFPDQLHHTSFKPVHVYSAIVLATSDALMYPKLLPFQKFYKSTVQGNVFTKSEISLMKFALVRIKESHRTSKNAKSSKYIKIIENYFPLRTTEQLRWRISSARNSKNKEINSVQFALQNKISYFNDFTKKHSEFNGIIRASFDVGQVLCPLHWLEKWMPEWLKVLKIKISQGEYLKTFPNLVIPQNTLSEVTKPQNTTLPSANKVSVVPQIAIPQDVRVIQPIQVIHLNEIPQVVQVPIVNNFTPQNTVTPPKSDSLYGNEKLKPNFGNQIIDPVEIEKYIAEMQNIKNQKKRNRRNNAYGARNVTDNDFVNEPIKEYQTSLVSLNQTSTGSTVKNYSRHDLHKIRFHLGLKKQEALQSGTWDISKDVYDPDEVNEACVKLNEDKKRKETENAERRKRRYNLLKKISNDDNGEGRDRKEMKISNNQSQKGEDPYKDLSKLQKKIKRQNDGKMAMHDPFYYNEAMNKISIIIGEDIQQKFSLHKGMLIELEELINQYGNDQKTFIEKLEQSWGSHFEFMTQLVSMLLDESNLSEEMCTNPTRIVQINALEIILMIYIYCRHSRGKISAKNVFRTIEKEFQVEGNEIIIGKRLLEIFKKETPLYNYLKKFVQLDIDNDDISDEEEFIDGTVEDFDFSSDSNQVLYM